MLVADADGEGHRGDPAADRSPESVEKLLVAAQEDDHLVAAPGTHGLQVIQDSERPGVDVAVGHAPLGIFAVDIGDCTIDAAVAFEDVDQGRVVHQSAHVIHRTVTVIMRFDRGRKLICASSSMGSLPARVRRKRRDMAWTWTSISNIAMFSPMQCRGPTANGM